MAYTADVAIKIAKSQIGYRESGTNDTKYNRWLGKIDGYPHSGYGYPWCASFQSWVADQAGGRANVDYPKTAGCAVAVSWFKAHDRWSSTPHVGDWVFYGPGGTTHVELVVAVSSGSITTIGGNTSGSLNGTYYNGDGVYRKTVSRSSSRIYGYGRPAYAKYKWSGKAPKPPLRKGDTGDRVRDLQNALLKAGQKLPKYGVDGDFGAETEAAVKAFQRSAGLPASGVYDEKTAQALQQKLTPSEEDEVRYYGTLNSGPQAQTAISIHPGDVTAIGFAADPSRVGVERVELRVATHVKDKGRTWQVKELVLTADKPKDWFYLPDKCDAIAVERGDAGADVHVAWDAS